MIRKLAREAVIFMLVCATLSGAVTLTYELYQRHKAVKATEQYKLQTAQKANVAEAANPSKEHTVWIYVDETQEFDGYLVERPHPPPQIAKMIKDGVPCQPGELTWSPDNTEWVCVLPQTKSRDLPAGLIVSPIPKEAASGHLGQYTAADINWDSASETPPHLIMSYGDIGMESLMLSAVGFAAGLGLWLFYRLLRFAVKG